MKRLKLRGYILQRVKAGESLSPSDVLDGWNKLTGKSNTSFQSVSQMLKRMGYGKEGREQLIIEKAKAEAGKDILDYDEWKAYYTQADTGKVQVTRIKKVAHYLRMVWEMMGQTDPHTWKYTDLMEKLELKYPKFVNAKNQRVFSKPQAVQMHLSAVNTVFKGIVPESFSGDLSRKAGELKDYLTFEEFNLFIQSVTADPSMSAIGWRALFSTQVNLGCREGQNLINGILGLKWENINMETRRASVAEKGGRGNASRVWQNCPLDLFPWLRGWDNLMLYWMEAGKPSSGRCFPVTYKEYSAKFHATRKACNGRISGEKETFTPHIFRKTHAQWLVKLRYPLEIIAGKFPNGRMGVGWDNINILRGYYVEPDESEYEEAEAKATARMKALNLV